MVGPPVEHDLGVSRLSILHVPGDPPARLLAHEGAEVGRTIGRIAYHEGAGPGGEQVGERVDHQRLDNHPVGGDACCPLAPNAAPAISTAARSRSASEHTRFRVGAQLELHGIHPRGPPDGLARRHPARERDVADLGPCDQLAREFGTSWKHREQPGREGVLEHLR